MPLIQWRVLAMASELQDVLGRDEEGAALARAAVLSLQGIARISEPQLRQSLLEAPEARRAFGRAGCQTRSEGGP